MPIATRTFRVFVSSTFEDLKEERNALQREVFPKLRALCEQHGARFQAIDLRWGVRDEAALDQKTMEICLREIERCQRTGIKPNFIVLLGQRYGWRPLPSRIDAAEFEAVRKQIGGAEDRALVESWYRRDDNAVPPEYVLKPRSGDWVQPDRWQPLESRIHSILLAAAQSAGLLEEARVKFEASATHQEILKGIGDTPEDRRHVFVFYRNVPDEECDPDLVELKRLLQERLPAGNIVDFAPDDFEGLCENVEGKVRTVIESEAAGFESRPALALEIEAHDAFARERALVFGREDVLQRIADYLRGTDSRPLVVHGPSGSGKSAVMAQASERVNTLLQASVAIRRFIGATPESSSGLTLFRSLCEQIGKEFGITGDMPVDFNDAVRLFRERLALASPQRPLVVFLDALDQLGAGDTGRSGNWLPKSLPPGCRIVVSTTELFQAVQQCAIVEITEMPHSEAATAIEYWLKEAHRTLQVDQLERVLAAFSRCGLPLYLKLGFEEARGWTSWQPLDQCTLGDGIEKIVDALFSRLSLDANHGALLVSRSLGYLAAARYGLTEDEIIDVLSADHDIWQDFERRAHHTPPEHRLPAIVWSRLFLDLEPYLTENATPSATLMAFYHRQVANQAIANFLRGEHARDRHASLSGYFARQPHFFDNAETKPNARMAAELNYHQRLAGQIDRAFATLVNLLFIAAKCAANMVLDLQQDYAATMSLLPGGQAAAEKEARMLVQGALWAKVLIDCAQQRKIPLPDESRFPTSA